MPNLSDYAFTLSETAEAEGRCVMYIMSRDQRVHDNHALLAAQHKAVGLELPLYVAFNVLPRPGVRAKEHVQFMLSGLHEVQSELDSYNIPFLLTYGQPDEQLGRLIKSCRPQSIYYDFNPLPSVRSLQRRLARSHQANHYVVDTHNIIPCWRTTDKQEFAAHTFRRKVSRLLELYMVEPPALKIQASRPTPPVKSRTFHEITDLIADLPDRGIVLAMKPGSAAAQIHLRSFINERLKNYPAKRNDIAFDTQSGLSPYLHFGHTSALRVALEVLHHTNERPQLFSESRLAQTSGQPSQKDGMNVLFEEMIVRKELSDNFCLFASQPHSLQSAPVWAQKTLEKHRHDKRDVVYHRHQWEAAKTHDPAWNAAQNQLRRTGKIHGYMRMYWAKKILEWSATPELALADATYLNDAYSIDGADPNGYVGILWSIAGLHDRPWVERPVFGQIRYMNSAGLKRKFDLDAYIKQWS